MSNHERSDLIDVTYERLHAWLDGRFDAIQPSSLPDYIKPRIPRLRDIANPFGTPSTASRDKIKSGNVTLSDGISFKLEEVDKDLVLAISDKFRIDEVEAFILLRSFLYNEPSSAYVDGSSGTRSIIEEWIEAITPFYYSQRLFILRIFPPLFRAKTSDQDSLFSTAQEILPEIAPDGCDFASNLIIEYERKRELDVPSDLANDPRAAVRWAKQNHREQLVMLEVLFWTMWDYAPGDGQLVPRILDLYYESNMGTAQKNATLLLDDEALQLQQDSAAIWILIIIEILALERISDPGTVLEISAEPKHKNFYVSDPESLAKLHQLITSHTQSQHSIVYLAWAFVLSKVVTAASKLKDIPNGYRTFLQSLSPRASSSYSREREPMHMLMAATCLRPNTGLFKLMHDLLTTSALFVSSVAAKTNSSIFTPNIVASRSVFKGLLIALLELVPVERIPDFNGLLEVWIALFGRSEAHTVRGITRQFWDYDIHVNRNRRALLDVARTRFPVQFTPLVRLLRSLSGTGFVDTDPLCVGQHYQWPDTYESDDDRDFCGRSVFHHFARLSTYSHVISLAACTGPNAVYEKLQERSGAASSGLTYVNVRPIKLPGGSMLPAKTSGKLLSDEDKEFIVIAWDHGHSGWMMVLEVLTDYVNRRRRSSPSGRHHHQEVSFARRGAAQPLVLGTEDIGMEMDPTGDENMVVDALDLVRSVIQGNPLLATELLTSLESGDHVVAHTMVEATPPDLVQLTATILEEALSRGTSSQEPLQNSTRTQLITSAIGVLSALLDMPGYSGRVWLYIRSTHALFGSENGAGFASVALAAERLTGTYTMTLALLRFVQQLFVEASASVLYIQMNVESLQRIKEEVLLRAARFVHSEIWVEHLGWKYTELGDRLAIGHRITSFFADVMAHVPLPGKPASDKQPFLSLCQAVADAFLYKASTSTINPLVSSIAGGASLMETLHESRRYSDCWKLRLLLKAHLTLVRLVLNYKQLSSMANKPCLLEQALCSRVTGGSTSFDTRAKVEPIDVMAGYVKNKMVGELVRHESIKAIYSLCASLSTSQPSPPTIIGHLSDPEATVKSLVRLIQHPYDELALRIAVWNFISLAVLKEPALASLLVTGQFYTPVDAKGKGKESNDLVAVDAANKMQQSSALQVAKAMLGTWKTLWEHNPPLLASILRFLDVVWQHGLEHQSTLEPTRQDAKFWAQLADIVNTDLGLIPGYKVSAYSDLDEMRRADCHFSVATHAYRTSAKSFALHIIGLDIENHLQGKTGTGTTTKPLSFVKVEACFKAERNFTDLVLEASPNSYDPSLHDTFLEYLKAKFPPLALEQLEQREPIVEREYGDDFYFSTGILQTRLFPFQNENEPYDSADEVDKQLRSVNLNLSLTHSQIDFMESWQFLLRQAVPFLRNDASVKPTALSIAATFSLGIVREARSGDMMTTIHAARLSLLLSLLEVAWFWTTHLPEELKSFMSLVDNVTGIILCEPQPPANSILGIVTTSFHRPLLQIIFFCAKQSRNLARRPNALGPEQRLTIGSMLDASLGLTIAALRAICDSACTRLDVELDRDLQLLVSVFDQCTRPDINPSTMFWLTRCIETDVIKSSLNLFVHADLVGLSDLPLLLSRKQPLYTPHIFMFHLALARNPAAAEKLANEGVLTAYASNNISSAICEGKIDVVLPELPGERSPAHRAYCSMLAIVAGVMGSLGRQNHFFDAAVSGFVQLYSAQIHRALSWTIGDTITLPFIEELGQVVNIFAAVANSIPTAAKPDPDVSVVLRVFSTRSLLLLQQLNYALTHPNHLASLLEPVTADERAQLEETPKQQDRLKNPLIVLLVDDLFRLSSAILLSLITASKADTVLIGSQEDWPVHEAILIPHSKVALGEPASLGTLLELGNCTLDRIRDLSAGPPAEKSSVRHQAAYETARRNLEAVMIYSVTQLAMWLSKMEFDVPGSGETEGEELAVSESQKGDASKDRKAPKAPLTLAERLRRGMTVEMADDLEQLLKRGHAVLQQGKTDDFSQVLLNFFKEHLRS